MHSNWNYTTKLQKTWNEQILIFLSKSASHQDHKLTISLTNFKRGLSRFYFNLWISHLFWTNNGETQRFPQKLYLFSYLWICMGWCYSTDKDVAPLKTIKVFVEKYKNHVFSQVCGRQNTERFHCEHENSIFQLVICFYFTKGEKFLDLWNDNIIQSLDQMSLHVCRNKNKILF